MIYIYKKNVLPIKNLKRKRKYEKSVSYFFFLFLCPSLVTASNIVLRCKSHNVEQGFHGETGTVEEWGGVIQCRSIRHPGRWRMSLVIVLELGLKETKKQRMALMFAKVCVKETQITTGSGRGKLKEELELNEEEALTHPHTHTQPPHPPPPPPLHPPALSNPHHPPSTCYFHRYSIYDVDEGEEPKTTTVD